MQKEVSKQTFCCTSTEARWSVRDGNGGGGGGGGGEGRGQKSEGSTARTDP